MKKNILAFSILLFTSCFAFGQTWSAVGNWAGGYNNALDTFNGNLYNGGTFTVSGGLDARHIAVWNGSVWDSVGNGVNNVASGPGGVNSIVSSNNILYVGGSFDTAGKIRANYIAE